MWNKSGPSEDLSDGGTKSWGEGKTSSLHGTQKEPVAIHTKGRLTENENQEERGLARKAQVCWRPLQPLERWHLQIF